MHIIPVIDLQAGQVVRAVGGQRHLYRPIESALCGSADPQTVARKLCEHCATATLYVADLDALQGGRDQADVLAALLEAQGGLQLWLDAGFSEASTARSLLSRLGKVAARVRPVFGSESLRSREAWGEALTEFPGAVLSLDSRNARPDDPAGVWEDAALWPDDVIAMGLERVGSGAGPDLAQLARLRERAPQRRWTGSGGIRDEADLAAARAAGAHAWLVASALHDRRVPPHTVAHRAIQATVCGAPTRSQQTIQPGMAPTPWAQALRQTDP